jgi:methylenetetrahydrofolate dehydrogenase (NADP+)/methenyltetrahydrofolate cyclohydrolase
MAIIDGKSHAEDILGQLKFEIKNLAERNIKVSLAIVLVGDNPASTVYITNKISKAKELGIDAHLIKLPEKIEEEALIEKLEELNNNDDINGIIVQLPLPKHINKHIVQSIISPEKDVDGLNPINIGLLHSEADAGFIPCTPLGCLYLIKTCCDDLRGKNAVVIGRSDIVGKPMAALLLRENCTVTICHSKTKNLLEITKNADIVVAAMGRGHFLNKEYFKFDAIVIDVGITRLASAELIGDVDFDNVKNHVGYITPVPGGVGPMTIAYLMVNTVMATRMTRDDK